MSAPEPAPGPQKSDSSGSFLERAKFFREHVQSVLNVATGALVVSVTFLHDLQKAQGLSYLRRSWECLLATIFLGILYNYILAIRTRPNTENLSGLLFTISAIFHIMFCISMWYLGQFGLANIGT
jgi:hypothetical protein